MQKQYKDLTIFGTELSDGLVSVEAVKTSTIGLSGQRAIYGGEHIYKANGDVNGAINCFIKNVIERGNQNA